MTSTSYDQAGPAPQPDTAPQAPGEPGPPGAPLLMPLLGCAPVVHATAFVAPTAVLIGPVRLGARSGVWFQAVLRADGDEIVVGEESNLQDGAVVHTDPGFPARLGNRVSVGHHAVLHGCDIQNDVLVGMHATVLNGARIGAQSIIAAGAIVPEGRSIPSHSLVAGPHGSVVRRLEEADLALISAHSENYQALNRLYRRH